MKHNKLSHDQNQRPAGKEQLVANAKINQNEIGFSASADEVARRAYFSYVNEGSLPGRNVQHWLEAEAQLLAERDLTRVHGFHNPT